MELARLNLLIKRRNLVIVIFVKGLSDKYVNLFIERGMKSHLLLKRRYAIGILSWPITNDLFYSDSCQWFKLHLKMKL